MAGGLIASAVSPHTPRMGIEAKAPAFLKDVIAGSHALGEAIRALQPDLLVVNSTHWVTTFPWYATCHEVHRGHCVAEEAPDLIPGIPYMRPGDPVFANALIDALAAEGILAGRNTSPHYHWDYGSFVPLQYIDPSSTIPVVTIGSCLMADLDECLKVGALIQRTAETLGRRAVFIASTAFAHRIVRGPDKWPPQEHQDADRVFIDKLCDGRVAEAKAELPAYAKAVVAEMSGRPLAVLLGGLPDGRRYAGKQFGGYGQSSGSGNANVAIWPVQ